MNQLPKPKNCKALALYLLLMNPLRGYSQFEAAKSDLFFKFSTRVSDLVLDYELNVHKKREECTTRFKKVVSNIRYCLYARDVKKNLKLYEKINTDK